MSNSVDPHVEAAAKVIAASELYDWSTLPEIDPASIRDRKAFRQIAQQVINVIRGNA